MQNQEQKINLKVDTKSFEPFFEKKRKMSTWKGNSIEKLGDLLIDLSLDYQFQHDFPRLSRYNDIELIKNKFSPLKDINNPNIDLTQYENSELIFVFYNAYDDYHKSMKYGIFSLFNKHNNDLLNEIYLKNQKQGKKTLLVCFMENEDHYIGLAELKGNYNPEFVYAYWWNDSNLKGIFNVQWIFVKNFYFYKLKRFIDNPLSAIPGYLKSFEKNDGLYILDHYKQIPFNYQTSIFFFFQLFDQREDFLHKTRVKTDFNISLKKKDYQPHQHYKRQRKNSGYQKKSDVYEDDRFVYVKKK